MSDAILEGRDLRVAYAGETMLDVPRIEVNAGEVLALIGPNGAGKSTLLRVLGLLEAPGGGEVRFRGHPAAWGSRGLLDLRRRFACVFQEPLLCDTTVAGNAGLGLRLRGQPAAHVRTQVRLWLDRLGVGHLADRQARTLSGGEAQRVSLARAFAIEPDVLLLDEPFAALDPPTRMDLLSLLQDLLRQAGCTTVFVTHDREEAIRLGDRVAVMIGGRVAQIGRMAEVFGRPASEQVARFVGVETVLDGRVIGEQDGLLRVQAEGIQLDAPGKMPLGAQVLVCLRPEDVVIRRDGKRVGESTRNHVPGRVSSATRLEAQYRVQIDCGPQVAALVTKQSFEDMALEAGCPVVVSFKASAVHLIRR
jgi:molybdopterin-binding protein